MEVIGVWSLLVTFHLETKKINCMSMSTVYAASPILHVVLLFWDNSLTFLSMKHFRYLSSLVLLRSGGPVYPQMAWRPPIMVIVVEEKRIIEKGETLQRNTFVQFQSSHFTQACSRETKSPKCSSATTALHKLSFSV